MSRKKFLLNKRKNSAFPSIRKRAAEKRLARQIFNAALKYKCSVSSLQNCRVVLRRLELDPLGKYQELLIENEHHVVKRPRVFSAFDGISSGLVALNQMGIEPHIYFSSEIDEYCKLIQRFNFPNKVVQLGDICSLDCSSLQDLGPIDLLFGGSPCSDLSGANPARKGLLDETGTGPLFFHFLRLHLYFQYQAYLHKRKYFWFFENVASMTIETKTKISEYLGCQPLKLCASHWTGMKRERYFWTNIQRTEAHVALSRTGTEKTLQNYLCGSDREANMKLLPTFTSNRSNLKKGGIFPVTDKDTGPGYPYYSEIELLMGLPLHFTAGPNTPLQVRKRVLSKAWDVHTVKSLLEPLLTAWALQ